MNKFFEKVKSLFMKKHKHHPCLFMDELREVDGPVNFPIPRTWEDIYGTTITLTPEEYTCEEDEHDPIRIAGYEREAESLG